MLKTRHEVDGWIVETLDTTNDVQRYCGRCRKEQPIANFMRLVSDKQALFLARREKIAQTNAEQYDRASLIKKTMTIAHKMCNACAAKIRKERRETAAELDTRLRLAKRYENHVPNPLYVSPSKTPHEPQTITERELMVLKHRQMSNARRVDGKRKAEKQRYAEVYARYQKALRNEDARIKAMQKVGWTQYADDVQEFLRAYLDHLGVLRKRIRDDRYAHEPVEPRENLFRYNDYDSQITKNALFALENLSDEELNKVDPRYLPTAELIIRRESEKMQDLHDKGFI